MASIIDWSAIGPDGLVVEHRTGSGYISSPDKVVSDLVVRLDQGTLKVKLRPEAGESVRVFTRRSMSMSANGQPNGEATGTVVIEIVPDSTKPDKFVRLYVGKDLTLSTEDHYG